MWNNQYVNNWKQTEINYLKENYFKIPQKEIAKNLNRTNSAVWHKSAKLGISSRKMMIINMAGKHNSPETEFKKGNKCANTGRTWFREGENNIAKLEEIKKKLRGENHHNYKNGKSREPYPFEWRNSFKEQIRQRDKKCIICKRKDKLRKLCVHHIDGNKDNLDPSNLISLCLFHHSKIQFFQDDLQDYFKLRVFKLV